MDEAAPDATALIRDPEDPFPGLWREACDDCTANHAASDHLYEVIWICPDRVKHQHRHDRRPVNHSRPHPHHPPGTHDHQPGP